MKNLILLFGFFFTSFVLAAEEGRLAPDFKAPLWNNQIFSLSEAKGQVVIVHFWATWCAACKIEMPALEAYFKKHRAEGLRIIALSLDTVKDERMVRDLMKKYSFEGGMAKKDSYKAYGRIWKLPLTFVIDRAGILQKDGWNLDHELGEGDLEKVVTPLLKVGR